MVYGRHLTHFGHKNIIKFCNRPFDTVEKMDGVIIQNINDIVAADDILYCLGDFSFRGEEPSYYRKQINCKNVILIRGSHEFMWSKEYLRKSFKRVEDLLTVKIYDQYVVLCHYRMAIWDKSHYGSYHCFGHSHGMSIDDPLYFSMDVGVDVHNFRPISFEEVKEKMSKKNWKSPITKRNRR